MTGRCSVPQCTKDDNCAQDQECVHGLCVGSQKQPVVKKPPCDLESVYFGFDKSNLDSTATGLLAKNASCLKKTDMNVSLTGRADPRGTTEYNMALSDRRAQSAKDYLKHTGIAASRMSVVPRGALDATGSLLALATASFTGQGTFFGHESRGDHIAPYAPGAADFQPRAPQPLELGEALLNGLNRTSGGAQIDIVDDRAEFVDGHDVCRNGPNIEAQVRWDRPVARRASAGSRRRPWVASR